MPLFLKSSTHKGMTFSFQNDRDVQGRKQEDIKLVYQSIKFMQSF